MAREENEDEEKLNDGNEESYQGVGGFLLEIVKVFILAVVIIVPIRIFLFQPFFVQGASMEPNFENGEYLIVNELGYKKTEVGLSDTHFFTVNPFKELKRGDVIVFRPPQRPQQYFIKRVIALSGEKISVTNGKVYIYNTQFPGGIPLDESEYLDKNVITEWANGGVIFTLAPDEYFVMGDNRKYSLDSRSWGPLKKDSIMGKALLRAWPIKKMEVF